MEVKLIITLPVIIIVAVVAATGYIILSKTAGRKWGYTEERRKNLKILMQISSLKSTGNIN